MMIKCPIEIKEDEIVENVKTNLFKDLGLERPRLKVETKVKCKEGDDWEYFLSFLDLSESNYQKIREWIFQTTFKRKSAS